MTVPFISEAALIGESGSHRTRLWVDLDFSPGEHDVVTLLPPVPNKCRVDGVLTDFKYERQWRKARLQVTTPALPVRATTLNEVGAWVERFEPNSGHWLNGAARPLEDLGPLPYGYVKYRAQFSSSGQSKMFVSTFADDAKKIFVNGKLVAEGSNSNQRVEFDLSKYAPGGTNTLEIAYELFGSPNSGENLGELKGIEYARVGRDPDSASPIDSWQVQGFPAPMRGREIDPEFSAGGWQTASLGGISPATELVPAFTWCRAEFLLEKPPEVWWVPWKVTFEAERDALLYLNGKFVGRYATIGPQKDFYLPEPYLIVGGKKPNTLTMVLAYADHPGYIRTLRIAPYEEFATRRTHVEFEW